MRYRFFEVGIPTYMVQLWMDEENATFTINMPVEECRIFAADLVRFAEKIGGPLPLDATEPTKGAP